MGKKLESNFTNMVVVLFSVTLIASAAVGYVYSLTAGPIEAAKQAKQVNAIREVIPGEFDNDPNADVWKSQTADGGELEFYPAKKNGELVGTAVKTYTNNGFGGKIWLMVGFNPDGSVGVTVKKTAKEIKIVRTLKLKKQLITPAEYPAYYRLMSEWLDTGESVLLF